MTTLEARPVTRTPHGGFDHEHVALEAGARSGLPITVAVHSTRLGPALGGCRVWQYPNWQDGMQDALRLSAAMTLKCAVAGLDTGGGKSVIALAPGEVLDGDRRRAAMLDLADIVDGLGGSYRTAEDVGTSAADMQIVRERTAHVFGLPTAAGGIGEPAEPTAVGVYSALRATVDRAFPGAGLAGLRVTISGLGQVGSRLARTLAAEGAVLTVSDIDGGKQTLAEELGARWVRPEDAPAVPTDLFVPAGVGGVLTDEVIDGLDCRAVVGPANNQLARPDGADRLAARGILWAPDFVANAGGALFAILADGENRGYDEVLARVNLIGTTLGELFDRAERAGITPLAAAHAAADERLGRG
jgi:leucine dehydrogenase